MNEKVVVALHSIFLNVVADHSGAKDLRIFRGLA